MNALQKELKQLQNDTESAESKLKGFCEARLSKASTSFFSVMRPRLKCRNLMRYSERVQIDREDWILPILIEQYKNRNVNMYTPTAWDSDARAVTRAALLALQLGALEQCSLFGEKSP